MLGVLQFLYVTPLAQLLFLILFRMAFFPVLIAILGSQHFFCNHGAADTGLLPRGARRRHQSAAAALLAAQNSLEIHQNLFWSPVPSYPDSILITNPTESSLDVSSSSLPITALVNSQYNPVRILSGGIRQIMSFLILFVSKSCSYKKAGRTTT